MLLSGIHACKKSWGLPLLLVAVALFVSPAIAIPRIVPPGESGLSAPHKGKPVTCAVIKAPVKSSLRVAKTTQPCALCAAVTPADRAPRYTVLSGSEPFSFPSSHTAAVPARAPPA